MRRADVLSVRDQQIIVLDPITLGQNLPQGLFCLVRRLCLDVPQPIADAVNMRVHADGRSFESQRQNKVRRLESHAGEGHQISLIVGDLSPVFLDQDRAGLEDLPGLVLVEPDGEDQLFDLFWGEFQNRLWCVGDLKEADGGLDRHGIFCSEREHCPDQDPKGVPRGVADLRDAWDLHLGDRPTDLFEDCCDLALIHRVNLSSSGIEGSIDRVKNGAVKGFLFDLSQLTLPLFRG